jgi:hypothetical protein
VKQRGKQVQNNQARKQHGKCGMRHEGRINRKSPAAADFRNPETRCDTPD